MPKLRKLFAETKIWNFSNFWRLIVSSKNCTGGIHCIFDEPVGQNLPDFESNFDQSPKTIRKKDFIEVVLSSKKCYGELEGIF